MRGVLGEMVRADYEDGFPRDHDVPAGVAYTAVDRKGH